MFQVVRADVAPPRLHLAYTVKGTGCPDEPSFRRDIALRLGVDPFVDTTKPAERKLTVLVDAATPSRSITVSLTDRAGKLLGRRVISEPSSSCDELVANAAFAASVAIDPSVLTHAAPPPDEPRPEASPPTAPPEPPRSEPQPAPAPAPIPVPVKASLVPWLRAGASGGFGLMPAPSIGVVLGAALRGGAWSAGVDGRFDLPVDSEHAVASGAATLRTSLLTGALHACGHWRTAPLEPYLCAAAYVGAMRGAATGIARAKEDASPYVALGPRIGVDLALSTSVALDLRVDVPLAVTPVELRVDDRAVWASPTVAAILGGGIAVALP